MGFDACEWIVPQLLAHGVCLDWLLYCSDSLDCSYRSLDLFAPFGVLVLLLWLGFVFLTVWIDLIVCMASWICLDSWTFVELF